MTGQKRALDSAELCGESGHPALWLGACGAAFMLVVQLAFAQEEPPADTAAGSDAAESAAEAPSPEAESPGTADAAPIDTIPAEEVRSADDQPGDVTQLDVVVVTATKRSKMLREIAGSVDAVRGDKLEAMGAKDMESYLKLIPGVSLNKQEDSRQTPTIRGVGSDTRLVITQSTTGIYIDDMPFTDPYLPGATADLHPYDLERVEVLKGPQGTLFGSSSLGGAIRYITQKPQLGIWEGKLRLTGTSINEGGRDASGAGAFNMPLFGDEFAIRGAGVLQKSPGYIDDLSSGKGIADSNRKEQFMGRLLGAWNPLEWPLKVSGMYLKQSTKSFEAAFADQTERLERSNTPGPTHSTAEVTLGNFTAQYDFDWATVQSSTNRSDKLLDWVADGARVFGTQDQDTAQTPFPVFATNRSIAEELRLSSPEGSDSRWEWLGGIWYMQHKQFFFLSIPTMPPTPPDTEPPPIPEPDAVDLFNEYTDSSGTEKALFGEISRTLGDRWNVTIGGRYYQTQLHAHSSTNGLLVLAATQMPSAESDFTIDEKGFNPKASVKFELSDDIVSYALVSKGFRFGGVQVLPPPPVQDPNQNVPEVYKSDSLWNHELGLRTEWFRRRMTLDIALFYEKWKDLQLTQVANSGLFNFIDNVGSAHTQGVEYSLQVIPPDEWLIRGLSFNSSAAWIEAVTDEEFRAGSGTAPKGSRLPGTPEFQMANVLSYDRQFGRWLPRLSLTHSHVGKSFNDLFGTVTLGGYDTFDVDLHLGIAQLAFEPTLSFSVNNATDVLGVAGAAADPNIDFRDIYFIRPRTYELTLGVRF